MNFYKRVMMTSVTSAGKNCEIVNRAKINYNGNEELYKHESDDSRACSR